MKKITITFIFIIFTTSLFAQNVDSLIDVAEKLYNNKQLEEAIVIYNKLIVLDSKNAVVYNRKANCISKTDVDSAKIYYNIAITLDPNYSSPYYNLGLIFYYQENNYEKALIEFKKAYELSPDSTSFAVKVGMAYDKIQEQDQALKYYDEALEKNPTELDAYYYKASLYYELDSIDIALEILKTAIRKKANKSYFYTLKADIELIKGNNEQVVLDCNKALLINPEDIYAFEYRAEAYYKLSNFEKTIEDCGIILENDSLNIYAVYLIAASYYDQKEYEKCEYYIQKGINLNQEYSFFYQMQGFIYFYKKEYLKAKEFFEQAFFVNQEDLESVDYLIYSDLLLKTDSSLIYSNGIFTNFNIDNIDKMNLQVKDRKSKYNYKKLLKRFNEDKKSLSLDEYFMLYYGHSQQKRFSGYSQTNKQGYRKQFAKGDYFECIDVAEKYLKDDPLLIEAYLYIAYSHLYMGDIEKYKENIYVYSAFVMSISYSGDGKTPDTPYIIISIADEYNMMYFLGFKYGTQKLLQIDGHIYDAFEIKDAKEHESDIYFLIDVFFGKFK